MGWNTTLLVMNDGLEQLDRDPDAGKKIAEGIMRHDMPRYESTNSIGIGNHLNMVQVIASQHADQTQILAVGQNLGRVLNAYDSMPDAADQNAMAQILMDAGWSVKPPKKKLS